MDTATMANWMIDGAAQQLAAAGAIVAIAATVLLTLAWLLAGAAQPTCER